MRIRSKLAVIALLAAFIIACGSEDNFADVTGTSAASEFSTTVEVPTLSASGADPTATSSSGEQAETGPVAVFEDFPPFDVTEYTNSDDAAPLLEGLGDERGVPLALFDSDDELNRDAAAELWADFLQNSRVFKTKNGWVKEVTDYCVISRSRLLQTNDGGWFVGENGVWSVRHTEYTEWNQPRVVDPNPIGTQRAAFLRAAYDSLPGGMLHIQEDGLAHMGISEDNGTLHVFDNPDCVEIEPVTGYSSDRWEILGLGENRRILDTISVDEPQLSEEELLKRWNALISGVTIFSNLQDGDIRGFYCEDGTGFDTARYSDKDAFGKQFTWLIKNGSDIAKNSIWLVQVYEDPDDPQFTKRAEFFLDIEGQLDPYFGVLASALPDCSIELGKALVATMEFPGQGTTE